MAFVSCYSDRPEGGNAEVEQQSLALSGQPYPLARPKSPFLCVPHGGRHCLAAQTVVHISEFDSQFPSWNCSLQIRIFVCVCAWENPIRTSFTRIVSTSGDVVQCLSVGLLRLLFKSGDSVNVSSELGCVWVKEDGVTTARHTDGTGTLLRLF